MNENQCYYLLKVTHNLLKVFMSKYGTIIKKKFNNKGKNKQLKKYPTKQLFWHFVNIPVMTQTDLISVIYEDTKCLPQMRF